MPYVINNIWWVQGIEKWVKCTGCIVLFIKSLWWGSPGNPSLLETKELLFIGLVPWLVLLGGLAARNFKAHVDGSDALSIGSVNSSLKTLHPHPYPPPAASRIHFYQATYISILSPFWLQTLLVRWVVALSERFRALFGYEPFRSRCLHEHHTHTLPWSQSVTDSVPCQKSQGTYCSHFLSSFSLWALILPPFLFRWVNLNTCD